MSPDVVVKSKGNRATKAALWLSLILIFMMLLIFFAQSGVNWNTSLFLLILVGFVGFWIKRKKSGKTLTQYEIVNLIADGEYKLYGRVLNPLPENVDVERGGAGETYVFFKIESVTLLYAEGTGVVETHNGKRIEVVKRARQADKIAMELVKVGITKRENMVALNDAGLYEENE